MTFSQSRFFYSDLASENLWWVPISYTTQSNPDFDSIGAHFWIEGVNNVVIANETAPTQWADNDWVIVNIRETGYYRVNYDSDNWDLLTQQLNGDNFEVIHVINRAQLIDDSLNLARAEIISYDVAFGILEYLRQEIDFAPWSAVSIFITRIKHKILFILYFRLIVILSY